MSAINKHLKTEWEKLSLAAHKEASIQAVGEQPQQEKCPTTTFGCEAWLGGWLDLSEPADMVAPP